MPISWFPGHMHKARKALAGVMAETEIVIEILDARAPLASSNPLLARLRGEKPTIRVLNKADLASPAITQAWQRYFRGQPGSECLISGLGAPLEQRTLIAACERLAAPRPGNRIGPRLALITGIPNVGKSTLLNAWAGRKLARTGNEPAITRDLQRVKLDDRWGLVDSPGLLWPKLEDQAAAYRLAILGTIRQTALDSEDVAWHAADLLLRDFPDQVLDRYGGESLAGSAEGLMNHVGRVRGCLGRQGRVDLHKTAAVLLADIREGRLGPLSLEKPPGASDHSPPVVHPVTESP